MSRRRKTPKRTIVQFILDRSYSMMNRKNATISGFNEYLETTKREAQGEVLVGLVQFDDKYQVDYTAQPLRSVENLTRITYQPRGMTALYDAIGRTILTLDDEVDPHDRVLVVIMTDGLENASYKYTTSAITGMINARRARNWEFIYLGAGQDAWLGGQNLGFTQQDSYSYGLDPYSQNAAIGDVAFATASVTRGSTAKAYLAVSDTKKRLEGDKPSPNTPNAGYQAVSPKPVKRTTRSNPSHQNWTRQRRDSQGRFVKSN